MKAKSIVVVLRTFQLGVDARDRIAEELPHEALSPLGLLFFVVYSPDLLLHDCVESLVVELGERPRQRWRRQPSVPQVHLLGCVPPSLGRRVRRLVLRLEGLEVAHLLHVQLHLPVSSLDVFG